MMQMRRNGNNKPGVPPLMQVPISSNIPILGQPPPPVVGVQKHWRCTTANPAHTFTGDAPAVALPLNPMAPPQNMQVFVATGVCTFCALEWFKLAFPVVEELAAPAPPPEVAA